MIIVLVLALPLALLAGARVTLNWVDRHIKESRSGPLHTFPLGQTPAFLTDELAFTKAQEALTLDGYDLSVWQVFLDGRTKAPDGSIDVHLARNTINPNDGCIVFFDQSGKDANPTRIVQIELKGDSVECRVIRPK